MKRPLFILLALTLWLPTSTRAQDTEAWAALVGVLKESDDRGFQLDILKGIAAALKGQRNLKPPKGWEAVAARLGRSPNEEVRQLARSLSVTFGHVR